jgi:hypothetical protein
VAAGGTRVSHASVRPRVRLQEALSEEARRLARLAALLLPLRLASAPGQGRRPAPLPSRIMREALKWRAKDGEAVAALQAAAPVLLAVHEQLRVSA